MSCRRVLVMLLRMATVRPPRPLPTNRRFLRFGAIRFSARALMLLSMGTAPSLAGHRQPRTDDRIERTGPLLQLAQAKILPCAGFADG